MGCVNKSSKEFKTLAAKNNVASNTLELITHKYWLEAGNETLFPTDVYIQAQLGNTHYQEPGKSVRKLWNMRYNTPLEFSSMKELQVAYAEATKFFPKSAIVHYRNAKGNFVLSVKRPIERANYSKDSFFEDMDNLGSMKDIKLLNLGIKENQSYGIDKVQELYNRFNTDRTSRDLANRVFSIAKDLGLNITFGETLSFGTVGRYSNNNTITYKKSFLERDTMNNIKAPILLHEVIHALSMYALSGQTANWKRPESLEQFRTEMNSLYQELKDNPMLKGERGVVDLFEFVAELGNPVFRNKIKEIDKQSKAKQSFWSRLLNAFKSLLGLHVTNSYYQRSMNALDKAIDAFDLDTYMRYNGIKNLLRQGYNAKEWEFNSMSDDKLKQKVNDYFDEKTYNDELLSLKRKAIADGTFMKAPNGKDTNLTERQWLQVRTKAFKDWFGDWENDPENASKVVDENGEPLVVYHGGENNISSFITYHKDSDVGDMYGAYFTKDKKYAKQYNKGTLYDVFLNIKKPLLTEGNWTGVINEETKNAVKSKYDGIINDKFDNGILQKLHLARTRTEIVVFDPNQIKSATDNVGTFYSDHNEIYNYEVDNSNVNDQLSDNEKKDILRAIRAINEAKRSLIDTGGDSLYVVDHTDREGLKHLQEGQEGFLVKKVIDIKGLSKEEINNIKQLCNEEELRGALQNLNRLLERNGYRTSIHNSNRIDAEDKRPASDNARLDKQASSREARRGQGSQNSQEDFTGSQIKTGYDGTNHPRYMDAEAARELINSMSGKELKDELGIIKQESADYDIVNDIKEEPKHSGKPVPQEFTFADGTKVKAPFKPNAQQVDALNAMDAFMKSNETSMTLSGYAGTGKTSLMEMIAKKGQKQHRPVMFCATTNKAAAVLNERVSRAGFKASTLNKVFGISVEVDPNSKSYNARKLVNKLNDIDITPGTTIIIDEASMINEENYGILNNIAKRLDLKIIYVGDEAQLAPVNEDQISKVFRNGEGKVIRLTQVERTDDNAILKEATDIRNGKPLSGETSFNSKGEGVAYISPEHQQAISEVIEHYVKGLKQNPNHFRILAYTNKAVSDYNNQVRELLGYTSPIPQKGEPMTGYANWGYEWKTKSYRFINSESYNVIKTDKARNVQTTLNDGTTITMEAIPITLMDSMGHTDTFNFMDIKSNPQNRQAATRLAYEKKRLWEAARRVAGRQAKANIYAMINTLDSFLFVNDNIEDDNHNLIQAKTIDFGYAMTVHKSQGSTFTNVLMDDVDISRASMTGNNAANAMEMVDLGEESNNVPSMDNLKEVSEEVDLGDLSDVEDTSSQAQSQVANIRQQLEYVGVSRATDTVTIVSNKIKKEGSPLHPEKDVKDDTINNNNLRSENKKQNGEYKATDEFRKVQEGSHKFSEKGVSSFQLRERELNDKDKERIGRVLGGLLGANSNGSWHGVQSHLTHTNKDNSVGTFNVGRVDGKLFHDIFETVRIYLPNGELVDLHDDYSEAKCFVTDDGLCGFAIEPDGNLVSVFSLSPSTNKGFLYAIKDMVRDEGATHLDAYMSKKQPLQAIYAKTLGFHTASTMDYNMEYDHDDIAKNHGNPQVVFMVDHEVAEPKHFDKDSYDAAQQYQLSQLSSNKNLPTSDTTINIYAKTNENADLSNFAIRPFIHHFSNGSTKEFQSVEQAFQYIKAHNFANTRANDGVARPSGKSIEAEIMETTDGARLKSLGRQIKELNTSAWDRASSATMKELLKESFEQNSQATQRLLNTGNATLTHTQDKGKWGKEFPKLLMEVREELRNGHKGMEPSVERQESINSINDLYSEDGKTPVTIYRGYALNENREARNLAETVGKTAVDYDDSLKEAIYFTSNEDEAKDYAKSRTDKSEEPPTAEHPEGGRINRHYTGDYAKVSRFNIKSTAKVEHYKDIKDYQQRGKNSTADVIVLDKGTMWADNTEYIVKNPDVIVFNNVFQIPSSTEVETEDVVKPWRNDSSKSNETRRIYLKGQKEKGYFEVVKDLEDNNYSVHFKPTDSKNPNAFTQKEKETLFRAVADVIPEGANLSTWGELSKGGVHGLNKFADLGFTKTGERQVKMKTGEDVTIPIFTKNKGTEPIVENPSFPEGQTQQISLPGYEYFNDLYSETPVDAAWKIPYLKELDAQLSQENSQEENQNILNQMDNVLQSTSEKEYLQETNNSQKKEVEKNLDEYDKLNKQIDNLLGNQDVTDGNGEVYTLDEVGVKHLSAKEIRHTAELVANEISDEITRLNKDGERANKIFPTLNSELDFTKATRKQVVEAVGINRLIERAKALFDSETQEYDDIDVSVQADLITENWDAIMYLAADVFAMNEGFGITKDYSKGNFTTTENAKIDYDNFNDYSNDPDIVAEEGQKDDQEHWQVEVATIDVLNSMSALVRQGIHECYLLDKDGNKVMSKWNIAERVTPREAVNSILRWTQGSLSLDDMIKRLSDKQKQNPWLSQLIERLSDKSGNETDFQSQFYGVFSKHFQLYSIVLLEDGKYHSMIVNSHPALSEAVKTITSQFKIGEHPLFGEKGKINAKLLDSDGTVSKDFTLHKALGELKSIDKALRNGETLNDEMSKTATDNIVATCRVLGYNITDGMLTDVINDENIKSLTEYLGYMVRNLDEALAKQNKGELKDYDPFKFGVKHSIGGTLRNFLTPITDKLEDTAVNAFYDSGKMYQSYITPSFMTKLFNKFRQEGQAFEDFILDEYGSSEWFKFNAGDGDINRGWRNEWLRLLATDENARKVFDHKVELNFNKHNYMRNMSDTEYTLSLITEYFAENPKWGENMAPSWYRVPMQSNKPSSEFIKFYSYRGENYKDSIVRGLHNMFLQELSRIQTVRMRNMSKNDAGFINNFDTNGRKFCLLPVLNAYLENSARDIANRIVLRNEDNTISDDNTRFATLLQKKVNGEVALTPEEEAELSKLADKVIRQSTEDRVQSILDNWDNEGILEAAKSIKDIYPSELKEEEVDTWVRNQVENFLWNDSFASKNILQLTISDIAFYKNTEDLQKRLAQLHAPGIRGNIYATDYNGNRVSDGKYRTFILQDFDNFKSNIIANISEVFDRRIADAPENQKAQLMALKESLVGKDGKYTRINVTDAQGYSSPSSYRKKALIFGKWSKQAEDIYQKLAKGEYTYTDLETAFQPLKPFVYSKLTKNMGVENAPIHTMQVPFQAKNAEYLLVMADAILKGEELSRPNLLRAIYRVMEDSERLMPTKGIDTVQFESAIKSGLQGKMNIHQFMDMPGGEEAAYTYMKNQIFKEETDGTGARVYKNYNTDTFVHETSFEDYCMQQEVPEHFKEHSQAHGSQIRMITPSDLDLYTTDENGNQVDNYYEWTEPTGEHKKVKADEFRKEYENTIAESIEGSINNLTEELHLNSDNKKERNIALSKILQREILSSPRYGIDLVQACSIDKETGEFRIPKGDPIQAKRIEQLINSIIKNRINKQKIAGGPIVQVSNFGTSKQLHIRFNDRNGNLMPLESEYNAAEHDNLSYKDYCKKNQGGIAYFEVFCPIWANELFDKFANADGTINVEAINKTDPELLKMVSYRIPTEDKYSCAPMKVVGFMPREAGDAIMFPYELTEIDDSDFDVDKRYVMRKDIPIKTKKRSDIEKQLFEIASESYKKAHDGKTNNQWIGEQVKMFMDNPQKMKDTDKLMRWLYSQYQQIAYYTDAPTSGKTYRDNKIIDMTYAVLTNQMSADKILNPGGFDAPKKMGYMVAAYKNAANDGLRWSDLEGMSIDELKKLSYTDKDLTFADTQVQFYKQNSAAASLISVFAVNKVAHATLEGNDIFLDVSEICGDKDFTIAGTTFGGRMQIDQKYDTEGNLIGKTLGSLVSASADAVKDPILNLMNINMTTAGMLNTMLRLGMTFNDAALFLSQDVIERTLRQFNKENLTGYAPLSKIIDDWLNKYREKYNISDTSAINTEELTKEELIEGLTSKEHDAIDYKVLLAFQKMRMLVDAMKKPTFATRFNSISSAVGPLIIDNLIMEHEMEQFIDANTEDGTHFYTADDVPVDIDNIFFDHPILKQFSRTVDIAKSMFMDMPTGSVGFRNLLANLPKDIAKKVYNDKKLLDQFSNFYQSYLLIQSGVVDLKHLKEYALDFPKWFMEQGFKDKYPDNDLIQAIRMNVAKKTGTPYLMINITGMDEQRKEELRSAWIDLHKEDPELSQMLFNYSFFRAGIGFSPKTFMSLVPTYVKERLKSKDEQTSYIETYRNFPSVIPDLVINQFIRNNWNNNKLVPLKGGKDTHYNVDVEHRRLTVYRPEEIADLADTSYIKTKQKNMTYLWHFLSDANNNLTFELVDPLGNNGEYLEMSTSEIKDPLSKTTEIADNNAETIQEDASDLKTGSTQETSAEETPNSQVITKTDEVKNLSAFADLLMKQVPSISKEEALQRSKNIIGNEKMFGKFLQNIFKQKGLDLNIDEAINEFKKYC